MSHHELLDAAHNNVNVILCNHSNSERGFLTHFQQTLATVLDDPEIQIDISQSDADPLSTYWNENMSNEIDFFCFFHV